MYRTTVFISFGIVYLAALVGQSDQSNLTLTVDTVPAQPSGKSFLQRFNVQVNSAWNKFKCQFYTRATVPVAKLLNVKVPASMEIPNVTNCGQLNVVVSQLANQSLAEQKGEKLSEIKAVTTSATTQEVTSSSEATTEVTTVTEESTTVIETTTATESPSTETKSKVEVESSETGTSTTEATTTEAASTSEATTASESTVTSEASTEATSESGQTTVTSAASEQTEPSVKPVADTKN